MDANLILYAFTRCARYDGQRTEARFLGHDALLRGRAAMGYAGMKISFHKRLMLH